MGISIAWAGSSIRYAQYLSYFGKFFIRKKFFVFIFLSVISLVLLRLSVGIWSPNFSWINLVRGKGNDVAKIFIVDTPSCQIPNFAPFEIAQWNESFCRKYYQGPPKCKTKYQNWIYMRQQYIVMNLTAIHKSGYSLNSIQCCYRVIERVEQDLNNYDRNADNIIKYSKSCKMIYKPEQFLEDGEFLRAFCKSTSFPTTGDVILRKTLFTAKPSQTVLNKLDTWKTLKFANEEQHMPPSIVVLIIDSNSRLNTRRYFKKSILELEKLDAVEMVGHMSTSSASIENGFNLFTGYQWNHAEKYCVFYKLNMSVDGCSFVWKDYDKLGYITSWQEDAPLISAFNYDATGFVKKPTDFYARPGVLNILRYERNEELRLMRCLGSLPAEKVLIDLQSNIFELTQLTNISRAPAFLVTWISAIAHECDTAAQYADSTVANFIRNVVAKDDNTIFIFISDHGRAYGHLRDTLQGWYENKLPTLWIHLPSQIRQRFPEWYNSLHINSNRLTSHFDLYKTFVHILQTFDGKGLAKFRYEQANKQIGKSLLAPLPLDRKCKEIGIGDGNCACYLSNPISNLSDPSVVNSTMRAYQWIISELPEQCEKLTLKETVSARMDNRHVDYTFYTIVFYTDPGRFLFEATVRKTKPSGTTNPLEAAVITFEVSGKILRINKINRDVSCVKTREIQRFCYCK